MTTYDTKGTQFLVNTDIGGSPGDNQYIAFCVTSIDPIGASRSLIDVTTLCSEAREYKLAIPDGQEISVEAFYDLGDPTQEMVIAALDSGTPLSFKTILSSGRVFTFDALVMSWNTSAAVDNAYPLRLTLKPTTPIRRS